MSGILTAISEMSGILLKVSSRPTYGVHPYATAAVSTPSNELANGEDDVLSKKSGKCQCKNLVSEKWP